MLYIAPHLGCRGKKKDYCSFSLCLSYFSVLVPLDHCDASTSVFSSIITACLSVLSLSSCCSFLYRPPGIHTFTCHLPHGALSVLSTAWKLMAPEQCSDPIKVTSTLRLRRRGGLGAMWKSDGDGFICTDSIFCTTEINKQNKMGTIKIISIFKC